MTDLSGQDLGRYHLIAPLGQGGMATVYKAYDNRLEREVAIKVIRLDAFGQAAAKPLLARFEREGKSLARMMHPNIVPVYDFGETNGAPYLVMAYIPGGTLKTQSGKAMPYPQAAHLLAPVAHALAYAHGLNVIHRDVKPANILITASGQPMLSDFGIAKILEEGGGDTLTGTGAGIGTPEYMPPEQWTNQVVYQTDIYALGIVFYELVTGRRPYTADTPAGVLLKQVTEPLPPPTKFVPDLPLEVEKVLQKALAKQPAERYNSMADFAAVLEKLAVGSLAGETVRVSSADKPFGEIVAAKGHAALAEQRRQAEGQRRLAEAHAVEPDLPERTLPERSQNAPTARPRRYYLVAIGLFGLFGVVGLLVWAGVFNPLFLNHPPADATAPTPLPVISPLIPTAVPQNTLAPTALPEIIATLTDVPIAAPVKAVEPPACTAIGQTWTSSVDDMTLVCVPAGKFLMGAAASDKLAYLNETPPHEVTLDAFWIDQTAVTNAMYQLCVQAGKCTAPADTRSLTRARYYTDPQYQSYPVIYVDWNDATRYCTWAGRGLPTEAQWEKAARGSEGWIYPWGNTAPDSYLLNFNQIVGDTTEAGKYLQGASLYGAQDMAGNVSQWVADWYSETYYAASPASNPTGPLLGNSRVLRGSSWFNEARFARSSYRKSNFPDYRDNDLGIRCSR